MENLTFKQKLYKSYINSDMSLYQICSNIDFIAMISWVIFGFRLFQLGLMEQYYMLSVVLAIVYFVIDIAFLLYLGHRQEKMYAFRMSVLGNNLIAYRNMAHPDFMTKHFWEWDFEKFLTTRNNG